MLLLYTHSETEPLFYYLSIILSLLSTVDSTVIIHRWSMQRLNIFLFTRFIIIPLMPKIIIFHISLSPNHNQFQLFKPLHLRTSNSPSCLTPQTTETKVYADMIIRVTSSIATSLNSAPRQLNSQSLHLKPHCSSTDHGIQIHQAIL